MTEARNFIAALARAGKSCREIKPLVDAAYGDKSLSISQINRIIKVVKEGKTTADLCHSIPKKTRQTDNAVVSIAAAVEENRWITVRELAAMHGLMFGTGAILTDNLGLVKKSARWVPSDQKTERVDCINAFLDLIRWQSLAVLNNIITKDESAISFHTPETKKQLMQWVKKGQPGPIKARVHARRSKKMVLMFFNANGVIYMNYILKGETVNAEYIKKSLARFLKIFRKKRPITSQEWFLHWDNSPVHTAATVQDYLEAKGIKTIRHPPYSLDLAPADFFLFPKVKSELAGLP
jgi:hypothetical protein